MSDPVAVAAAVFAAVPRLSGPVAGCERCFTGAELALLGDDPSLVPDELVARFAGKVTDHWSPAQYPRLWQRLAPRILRLALEPGSDPARLLRGLADPIGGFTDWPAPQRAAVFDALEHVLTTGVLARRGDVMSVLEGVSGSDTDLPRWLRLVDTLAGPAAETGIAWLARDLAYEMTSGQLPWLWPAISGTVDQTWHAARDWLTSPTLQNRLNRSAGQDPDSDAAIALTSINHIH